jgi:hypothetical protein
VGYSYALTVTCNLAEHHIGMHARLRTVGIDAEIVALWNDQGGTFNGPALIEEAASQIPQEQPA